MHYKVLYTSDIHGNEIQYSKLINYAQKIFVDFVIIGGDIAPKNLTKDNYITGQRNFLKNRIPKLLKTLKEKLPNSQLYLMMGNDDCAANSDVLEKENKNLYYLIHNKRIKLIEDFEIVGYSYVPITIFGIKDWEKYDLSQVPPNLKNEYLERKKTNYRLDGKKSTMSGFKVFQFTPAMEMVDSIQKDLLHQLFTKRTDKTIYVFHSPPNKTKLDQIYNTCHVGSMAIRLFIENYQPYLTLHGHIHETVDVSGNFMHEINNTLCLTPGNHDDSEQLAVLVFDLSNPEDARRVII